MSETTLIKTEQTPGSLVVSSETVFSWADAGFVLIVVVVAFAYLYNRLWRKRGACSECGSKNGHCTMQPDKEQGGESRVPVNRISGSSQK